MVGWVEGLHRAPCWLGLCLLPTTAIWGSSPSLTLQHSPRREVEVVMESPLRRRVLISQQVGEGELGAGAALHAHTQIAALTVPVFISPPHPEELSRCRLIQMQSSNLVLCGSAAKGGPGARGALLTVCAGSQPKQAGAGRSSRHPVAEGAV